MGKLNENVSALRATIKEVIGIDRYRNLQIFADKRAHDYRFKIVGKPISSLELDAISNRMQEQCIEIASSIKRTNKCRGNYSYIEFIVPFSQ